ncbi:MULTISPECIES: GntR family transcriptional regulator [unclassified Nocardioides]|uniref:GntR family transcriptional regulator n=1 Tax=unclassified Nocardioides TaxID=2615069 RepID=UPI00138F1AAA|nr:MULTISPECIES: GntR family transcriptional regulator [unclassified Nocardioides]
MTSDSSHAPIRPQSLTDTVTERLRRMILSRELEPGRRITQAQLAEMLGISTMPIREALLRLVADGMVVASASRSFEVSTTTEQGIRDIYWAHGVLAGEMAARACDARTDSLVQTLQGRHEAYQAAMAEGRLEVLTRENRRFHTALNQTAASPTIGVLVRNCLNYFPDVNFDVPGWIEQADKWQADLIKAVDAGDREAARAASIKHSVAAGALFTTAYWQ